MQQTTLRQQAYQHLRARLLDGELTAGTQLSEPDLAKQLGMSRTPVREALRQMENEGLLDYAPRFGAMVRIPDRQELGQMYDVRAALESYAAAQAAQTIDPGEETQLDAALRTMRDIAGRLPQHDGAVLENPDLGEFIRADMTFHRIIIQAAGNQYMSRILDGTHLLVRVFTGTSWQYNAERLNEAVRFHERLVDALKNRDSEAARLLSVEAMSVARDNALRAWDQQRIDDVV